VDVGLVVGMLAALAGLWVALITVFWLLRPRDVAVRELVAVVPDLVRLLRSIVADRRSPPDVRLVLIGLLAWIVSPIDLIPEFIPVVGPIDDLIVAVAALRYLRRRMGIDELRRRWPGSPAGFALVARVMGSA
jgi:uncharacterized membrane protein YkvA (DUF1232 family)